MTGEVVATGRAAVGRVADGRVLALHVNVAKGEPLVAVQEVTAEVGRGLVGDRHFKKAGRYSTKLGAGTEVTLIESEALEHAEREHAVVLTPAETRRNVLTRGVALNGLVEKEFAVGELLLRGVRLCEPCSHLSRLTGKPCVKSFQGRGGLRAAIVRGGVLKVGDPIVLAPASAAKPLD